LAPRAHLGELEELVLLAVLRLGNEAYGAVLRRELRGRTGRAPSVSTIYITLMRLESKGLVTSRIGTSASPRGGRPRRLFTATPAGVEALLDTRTARERLWEGLDGTAPARKRPR
jgi:DNA-binding PadR family transcriptional regulator